MAWTSLPNAGFTPGEPVTQAQGLALRDNPQAIAERGTGAPIVQVPKVDYYTSGTTWAIPSEVTAFSVVIVGGGGGGGDFGSGNDGADTTFTYDGVTLTAGKGGGGGGASGNAGSAGTATNGDLNLAGIQGSNAENQRIYAPEGMKNYGFGGRGSGGGGPGGSAGAVIMRFDVNAAAPNPTFVVGAGGSGGDNGKGGIIIITY